MTILHLETEQASTAIQMLEETIEMIDYDLEVTRTLLKSLSWEGPSREEFNTDFTQLKSKIDALNQEGIVLCQRAKNEIAEWLNVDRKYQAEFGKISIAEVNIIDQNKDWIQRSVQMNQCWKNLSNDQKIKMIQYYISQAFLGENTNYKIEFFEKGSSGATAEYHEYNLIEKLLNGGATGVIRLNPGDDLKYVWHEIRHAQQHYWINNPDKAPSDISADQLSEWQENFNNYTMPNPKDPVQTEKYANQPVEVDARNAADVMQDNTVYNKNQQFDQAKAFCDSISNGGNSGGGSGGGGGGGV